MVLLSRRQQPNSRLGGEACLPSVILQRPHEPRTARSDYLLCFEAHPPRCCTRRIWGRVEGWREVAAVRAGFAAVFPDRAVRSLFRSRKHPLPRSNLPSTLASARSTPDVV